MFGTLKKKLGGPILIVLGLFGLYAGYEQNSLANRLKKEGVTAQAQVIDQHIRSGRRGSRTYLVNVAYAPQNAPGAVLKEFSVSKSAYEAMQPGTSVNVRHLPSDPEKAELEGNSDNGIGGFGFGGIMLAMGGVFSFLGYRKSE